VSSPFWWILVFFPIYGAHDISRWDNSFVYQVSSYNCLFTFSFRMQCMTRPVTREYYRCSNVLASSAETAQQWPAVCELRTSSCPQFFFFFLAIVLGNLLGAVVMPLLSTLKILFCAEKFLIFSNTALKLSKYLVTWTLLKPVFLPKLHFSEQSEIFCLLQTWPLSPFQQSYFLS